MGKRVSRFFVMLLAMAMILPSSAIAASANDVVGIWLTQGGKSKVQISKAGGQYIGKIIWLKEPKRNGKDKMDAKNPNKNLRSRKIVGSRILQGFKFKGNAWSGGTIYNPEDGKTYSAEMKMPNKNKINLRGYVMGIKALGKTQTWTRVK